MAKDTETSKTAEEYRAFGRQQARGRSPDYEVLAYAVAEDEAVLAFLVELPAPKRQTNLLSRRRASSLVNHPSRRRCTISSPSEQQTSGA